MDLDTRYRQTFAKLKAPPRMETEVYQMTEQRRRPKKFVARRLVVAAMAAALAGALAIGANAATGGELFGNIVITLAGEGFRQVESDDGSIAYQGQVNGEDVFIYFEEPDGAAGAGEAAPDSGQVELKESQTVE